MPQNFPGPWEVRFNYTVDISGVPQAHQFRLSFDVGAVAGDVGDAFTEWIPIQRDGGAVQTLDAHIGGWMAKFRALMNTDLNFINAELFKYAPGTFDATWYSTKSIVGAGTGAQNGISGAHSIWTFRTTNGGVMRFELLDSGVNSGPTQTLPLTDPAYDDLADTFLLGTNPWIGRDNGYPIAFLGFHPGINERLFKKRNR